MMICNKKTFYISKYNKIQAEGKKELKDDTSFLCDAVLVKKYDFRFILSEIFVM